MSTVVRYESAPFDLTNVPDSDGDKFVVAEIEGWDGMEAELALIDQDRDGSAFSKGRYPKRELNVKGLAIARNTGSNFDALRVRKKLEAFAADWAWAERWLYVDEPSPGQSLQAKTRPGGKLFMPTSKGRNQEFEIPFTCADPRKYSQNLESETVNGSKVLTNSGNFPTYAVATLSSTRTNPWIQSDTLGNWRITLQGSIPSGSTIDFLARRTIKTGVGMIEMAARPRLWFYLRPGPNTITSDGPWVVQWRHAWR